MTPLDFPAADLRVVDLGMMDYARALDYQRQVHQAVVDRQAPPTLLLVEHEPVITISRRRGVEDHLLANPDQLTALGIDVQETDRGGDITYHGPGQLVAYPIVRLVPLGLNVGRYMRWLEQIVIDTLAIWRVRGEREAGATGVWVRLTPGDPGAHIDECHKQTNRQHRCDIRECDEVSGVYAKICAMGVRVRKNVTMHGLALNVTTNLAHFQTIVPCGLAGRPVTGLRELLGDACPAMEEVKAELAAVMRRAVSQARPCER